MRSNVPNRNEREGHVSSAGNRGHKAKDCVAKEQVKDGEKKTDINSIFSAGMGGFRRRIDYQMGNEAEEFALNCQLDTLLDTGSPISFVKDIFVPPGLIVPATSRDKEYRGLNDSVLEAKGRVTARIALNNMEQKYVSLLVVPAGSMKASVVIGRDILLQFFGEKKSLYEEEENKVIREILNINIDKKRIDEALVINSEIDLKAQKTV